VNCRQPFPNPVMEGLPRYSDKWATILRAQAAMRHFVIAFMACALFSWRGCLCADRLLGVRLLVQVQINLLP